MAKILIGNVKGPKGDTGQIGQTGAQGPKGAKGDTGLTGPTAFKLNNVLMPTVDLTSARKVPTAATKLIVQMQDASGKVCYVEASAENTYLADGTTVQSRLANAVYFA